ncbi:hypothetical protein [Pseudofrankia asymbiotica]|uniref:hypothetical protein n=1 Tax=Pseudofrankia asymbiotica TaxID=1834516 RepID=UPI001F51ACDC|nr:hypothetical protein [Pseudofrankia asymbiotica]
MLAAVAVALWLVDLVIVPAVPHRVVLRSIALTVEYLAIAVLVGGRRGRVDGLRQFRLGPWSLLVSAVTMGLASVAWRNPQPNFLATIDRSSVAHALAIVGLAAPLWAIGYLVGPGLHALRAGRRLAAVAISERVGEGGGTYRPMAVGILAGVSVVARVAQITLGQFGYLADPSKAVSGASWYAQILVQAGGLGVAALAMASVELARFGGIRRRTAFLVLLGIEVGFGLISGMKGQFVWALLAVCVSFTVVRGRLPLRSLLGAVAIFVLVVVPFNASYRDLIRTHGKENMSASAAVAMAPQVVVRTVQGGDGDGDGKDQPPLTTLINSTVTARSRSVDSVAAVVQKTPSQVPYRSISELFSEPVQGLVPRALWPGKPVRTAGYTFNQEYYGTPRNLYSAAGISPQADLFRHGGLLVLLVGSVVIGAGYRFVDETLHPAREPRLTALYMSLFTLLLSSEWTVTDVLMALPFKIGIMVVACRFVYGGRPARDLVRFGRRGVPAARRGHVAWRASGSPGVPGASGRGRDGQPALQRSRLTTTGSRLDY